MRLTKQLVNRPVRYLGFDGVTYDGHIDNIRFPDQFNCGMVQIGYHVPNFGYATANLDRAQFAERCTLS